MTWDYNVNLKLLANLNSDVSESSILIAEKGFEFAEVVASRRHAQTVAVELEDSPEKW
jgi:hypothetical protein